MKKKIICILTCVSVLCIVICTHVYTVRGNSLYNQLGYIFNHYYQQSQSVDNNHLNSVDAYAYGKNATVSTKDVLQAKEYYMAGGLNEDEAEEKAASYMMEREALYNAAIRSGYSVTNQEVREYVAELKELLESSDQYDLVLAVMDSFDSEEEYWEYQFTVYQINLPIQKYVQALQLEFQNSLATTYSAAETNDSASNYTELWNDYYDSYKQDLVEQENYSLNNNILQ